MDERCEEARDMPTPLPLVRESESTASRPMSRREGGRWLCPPEEDCGRKRALLSASSMEDIEKGRAETGRVRRGIEGLGGGTGDLGGAHCGRGGGVTPSSRASV